MKYVLFMTWIIIMDYYKDYYKDYEKFLATYGGECMEFGLSTYTNNKSLSKYKDVMKIGRPFVVEFAIPFSWMSKFDKMDVARYMLEEWTHLDIKKDKVAHRYDGRVEREIPADKIIAVHEVEDSFPEIDRCLFRED